jgi:hypothetical protein
MSSIIRRRRGLMGVSVMRGLPELGLNTQSSDSSPQAVTAQLITPAACLRVALYRKSGLVHRPTADLHDRGRARRLKALPRSLHRRACAGAGSSIGAGGGIDRGTGIGGGGSSIGARQRSGGGTDGVPGGGLGFGPAAFISTGSDHIGPRPKCEQQPRRAYPEPSVPLHPRAAFQQIARA